jgi:hypothetical protein
VPPAKLDNPTRDNILKQLYERSDIKKIVKKIAKDKYLTEELGSELFFYLCKMKVEKLIDRYNRDCLDFSILRFLTNAFHSKTSPFYHKIKKHVIGQSMTDVQRQKYIVEVEKNLCSGNLYYEALDTVMSAMNSLPPKHLIVLKMYIELKSYKKVSEKTAIAPKYVSQMVKDARTELGKKIAGLVEYYKEESFIKDLFENYSEDLSDDDN